jgi:hypothetical protein
VSIERRQRRRCNFTHALKNSNNLAKPEEEEEEDTLIHQLRAQQKETQLISAPLFRALLFSISIKIIKQL